MQSALAFTREEHHKVREACRQAEMKKFGEIRQGWMKSPSPKRLIWILRQYKLKCKQIEAQALARVMAKGKMIGDEFELPNGTVEEAKMPPPPGQPTWGHRYNFVSKEWFYAPNLDEYPEWFVIQFIPQYKRVLEFYGEKRAEGCTPHEAMGRTLGALNNEAEDERGEYYPFTFVPQRLRYFNQAQKRRMDYLNDRKNNGA